MGFRRGRLGCWNGSGRVKRVWFGLVFSEQGLFGIRWSRVGGDPGLEREAVLDLVCCWCTVRDLSAAAGVPHRWLVRWWRMWRSRSWWLHPTAAVDSKVAEVVPEVIVQQLSQTSCLGTFFLKNLDLGDQIENPR